MKQEAQEAQGSSRARILLIAGPTASGKSALALALARKLRAIIINADSMQVYRDLRVLTARPDPQEEKLAPHRLYGHVDGAQNYSLGRWLEDCAATLAARQDSMAIIVGGTGLYFKALTQGVSAIPPVSEEARRFARALATKHSAPELHALLSARDPKTAARLRPSDPQRIVRALEVFESTGKPLADFYSARQKPLLEAGAWRGFFLSPDRAILRTKINERLKTMVANGALEEIQNLAARGLDRALPIMRAHGVPHFMNFTQGTLSLEAAIAQSQADTRAYCKRQFTFARQQLPDFAWITPQDACDAILSALPANRFDR